jgi:AcrR family transcriptional regulator
MVRVSADTRRDLLVDAAIRVMVRDGVAKATVRSIVAEAEMPLGVFHYCFRSKEELLNQVIETIAGHTVEPALAELRRPGTLQERLDGAVDAYWQHVVANPDEHRVTYELTSYAVRQPGLEHMARTQYEKYIESFTAVLDLLGSGAGISWRVPVPVLSRYLTAMVDGVTLLWLNEGGDDRLARQALDCAVAYLLDQAEPA